MVISEFTVSLSVLNSIIFSLKVVLPEIRPARCCVFGNISLPLRQGRKVIRISVKFPEGHSHFRSFRKGNRLSGFFIPRTVPLLHLLP